MLFPGVWEDAYIIYIGLHFSNIPKYVSHNLLGKVRGAFKTHRQSVVLEFTKWCVVEMVRRSLDSSFSSNVQYCIEISILVKNLYPVHFLRISQIIGGGYCWHLTSLSNSLRSVTQWILPFFWGGVIKVGEDHLVAPCGCTKTPISQRCINSF